MSGAVSYYSGLAAEEQVAAHYMRSGCRIAAQRWRGKYGGEIDLIARDGERVVFIEVKRARTHAQAAERLSQRQMLRILRSAEEFLANEGCDEKTDVGYDLALVDGGGRIEVLENALYLN